MATCTLLMKNDKSLVISVAAKIRQRELNVDAIQVLIPTTYNGMSLEDFIFTMQWVNEAENISHEDTLVRDEDIYKDEFYRFVLPVTSIFTKTAGIVKIQIIGRHLDTTINTEYILRTGEVEVEVLTFDDYFRYVPTETIASIDAKMLEIDNEIQKLNALTEDLSAAQVDDLTLSDAGLLQLTAKGETVGDGVDIGVDAIDDDGTLDGVITLVDI